MPLSKTVITTFLLFCAFFITTSSFAQTRGKSRTNAVIPYNHKVVVAPPGMVYIPGGTTVIKYDPAGTDTNSARMVSLTSFFIDKTEITNQQYRSFIEWVVDSIAVVKYLKDEKYFYKEDPKPTDANASASKETTPATPNPQDTLLSAKMNDTTAAKTAVATPADTSAAAQVPADTSSAITNRRINWSKVNHNKIWNPKGEEYAKLAPMMDENGNVKKEYFNFTFKYLKVTSTKQELAKNRKYVIETLNIYPDELCWAQDLTNSQVDMYVENYFKAPPFDDYPVVGVTWMQARAYTYWRTATATTYYNMPDYMKYYSLTYTLPSEAQWVYAAQGFYDMIMPSDSTENDTSTVAKVEYPSDSTVTPHDSTWVANYIKQHGGQQPLSDSAANAMTQATVVDTAKEAAVEKRNEARAKKKAKKRADERFNYYISDFVMKGKYGGKYSGGPNGTGGPNSSNMNPPIDPDNPPIDSSAVHFDPNGMLTNFKQDEGDYWEDGSALTLPVMAFAPNEFGLHNMEGNVSEWTLDAYSPSTYAFVSDLNPVLLYDGDPSDAEAMKRKVVRGGSFMSNAKSLDPYYRDMEMQNVAHCFIGFRCVMQAPEVITKKVMTRNRTVRGNPAHGKFYGARLPEIH